MGSFKANTERWSIPLPGTEPIIVDAPGVHEILADYDSIKIVKLIDNVIYAKPVGYPLKMQLLIPTLSKKEEKRPLLVFIRGSAWQKQNSMAGIPQLVGIAKRGYVVASVEIRPAPDYTFPSSVEDGWTALHFLLDNAEDLSVDINRIALWGSSSGGHIAMLMSLMPEYANEPIRPKAVISYYGPADLKLQIDFHSESTDHMDMLLGCKVLNNPDKLTAASPISYVHEGKDMPAFFFMHGDMDRSCTIENSIRMYRAVKAAGGMAECIRVHKAAHGGVSFWNDLAMDMVDRFLKQVFT